MELDRDTNLEEAYNELRKKDKKRHANLADRVRELDKIEELNDTDDGSYSMFLPSSMVKENAKKKAQKELEKEKKKEEEKEPSPSYFGVYDNPEYDPDEWFDELMAFNSPKVYRGKGNRHVLTEDGFISGKKKKKKKEKAKDGTPLVDYKKEFAPDMALFKNLLVQQNKFTDSLQKEYDYMQGRKSSSRGVTKQLTDLIENINGARSLSMQLVEKNVQAKKLIAELTLKQQKELGNGIADEENLADFGSQYLKNMLENRKVMLEASGAEVVDMDEDSLFDELNDCISSGDNFDDDDDLSESDLYLKYENRGVTMHVHIFKDDDGRDDLENYVFEPYDKDGNYIDDYPIPTHTKISVNNSTNIATDAYGNKYPIIWYD